MLYTYTPVPHPMDIMQSFIDFIFYDVWCTAPENGDFSLDLFDNNPELKEVMVAFYYDDTKAGDFFYGHVQLIYDFFSKLMPAQVAQIRQWYQANNDIKNICTNSPRAQIARYADIAAIYPDLCKHLKSFFQGLYNQNLLNIKALKDKIGHIDEHYKAFMKINKMGKCPFCGLNDIKGIHHKYREAYDHYLPKGLYPFNSINFRNLAPCCHECNSTYKLKKDPAHNANGRRKSFYPYADEAQEIEVTISLNSNDFNRLTPDDICLSFGPTAVREEIETWQDIFGIAERYKAKCSSESDGKYWLEQILDEWKEDDRPPEDYLTALTRQTKKKPLADCNFLKKAFLEGCQRAGAF